MIWTLLMANPVLRRIAAAVGAVVILGASLALWGHIQRQRGAAELQSRIDRADKQTLQQTLRNTHELRNLDAEDLVNELSGGKSDGRWPVDGVH